MTAIWYNDGSGWNLLTPTGFPNEATLLDALTMAYKEAAGGEIEI